MSAIRKLAVSVATLFLALSALFMTAGTASAEECDWTSPVPCKTAN